MKNKKIYFILAFVMMLLAACDDDYTSDAVPKKLFRPVNFTWEVVADYDAIIKASWRSTKADSYLLQIATENTFSEDVMEIDVPKNKSYYDAEGLIPGQKYYARVKAVSANPAIADSEFTSAASATLP